MNHPKSWIITANSAFARIFAQDASGKWEEINSIEHEESRLKNSDLVTDKEGTSFDRMGPGRTHMDRKTSPKEHEVDVFVHELATYLRLASQLGKFAKLHIVAAPAFLGKLRAELHQEVATKLGGQISKDLVHESLDKVLKDLEGHFLS